MDWIELATMQTHKQWEDFTISKPFRAYEFWGFGCLLIVALWSGMIFIFYNEFRINRQKEHQLGNYDGRQQQQKQNNRMSFKLWPIVNLIR